MLKSTAVLCVLSILLCFNLNYTFPYNRGSSKKNIFHGNHSNYCDSTNTADRAKKMASITENTLKIIDSTVPTKSFQRKTNMNRKSARKDEDLSHYEQMVIMKKNPYLDLKELELKLYNPAPACKNVRASVAGAADVLDRTVGICEEGPLVEIINRGLTGFAIPAKLIKSAGLNEGKSKAAAPVPPLPVASAADTELSAHDADDVTLGVVISKKTEQEDKLLNNLVKDIKKFEESKLIMY